MIKLFEMFAGYGGASFALEKAGIPFEGVGYSEIDKFAIKCFNQNHCLSSDFNSPGGWKRELFPKNFGDCTKINPCELPDFDLLTGGFPCQSFSVAGKGLGELDTRGTLFNDIIRIAEVKKPKYMLLENVKGLTNKRHKATFDKILEELNRIGYQVEWRVLNSKEHGIPQNRERVFFVCFRDDVEHNFKFPEKEELTTFLKDILEEEVDEKYYLSDEQTNKLLFSGELKDCFSKINYNSCAIRDINRSKHQHLGEKYGSYPKDYRLSLNKEKGVSYIVKSSTHEFMVILPIKNATKKGYLEGFPGDGVNLEQPNSKTRRGRIQKDVMGTLQTNDQRGVITEDFRIRKLTPKECFRLMGFNGEINLDGLSNSQRYKLAGNGWDINLVSKIFNLMSLQKSR